MPTDFPSTELVWRALQFIGQRLDQRWAWYLHGEFHFTLEDRWSLAVSAESAGRLRLDVWCAGASRYTVWARPDDTERLAYLVRALRGEVEALVA